MEFEVIDSKVARFKDWAVKRFDEWWIERRIRVANHQIKLAGEVITDTLKSAAEWRGYATKLKDLRQKRGFPNRGNDWKPPVDWLSIGAIGLTLAIGGCTVVLAMH